MIRKTSVATLLSLATCFGCGGASDKLPTAPAGGTVTVDGNPVPDAIVMFYPEGQGQPASGRTDASGEFTLTTKDTNDGAMVGSHTVIVKDAPAEISTDINDASAYEEQDTKDVVPDKYANPQSSGLKIDIPEGGNTEIKLELTK